MTLNIIEMLNTCGRAFVGFAWPMLIQSCILIAVMLLVDLAIRKRVRALVRYWLLMLVLVKLLLPTSLMLPVSVGYWVGLDKEVVPATIEETRRASSTAKQGDEDEITFQDASADLLPVIEPRESNAMPQEPKTMPIIEAKAPSPTIDWQAMIFLGWLAVTVGMGLLVIQRYGFVRGLIRQSNEAEGMIAAIFNECCQQMTITRKPELKMSPAMVSPAACGLVRPVVIVPELMATKLSKKEMHAVLLHELTHIQRGDLWMNCAQTLLQVAYFYNPLLWLANSVIRRLREQAVDETVLVTLCDKAEEYPQVLVTVAKLAMARPALSLRLVGVVESKSALAGRIKHMLSRPFPKSAKLGGLGLAGIFIIAALLLPMAKGERKLSKEPQTQEKMVGTAQLTTENTSTPKSNGTFKATFSNGVTAELVGVSYHPSEGKQWWRADGSELEQAPYARLTGEGEVYPQKNDKAREIALRLDSTKLEDASFDTQIIFSHGGSATGCCHVQDNSGKEIENLKAIAIMIPEKQDTITIQYGMAAGKWETLADYYGVGVSGSNQKEGGIYFAEPYENGKEIILTISTDIENIGNVEKRLIAIDEKGNIHVAGNNNSVGTSNSTMTTYRFSTLHKKQIKKYQFQTRPYEWIEFKNISLEPGVKTDVEIVDEKGEKRMVGKALNADNLAPIGKTIKFTLTPEMHQSKQVIDLRSGRLVFRNDSQDFIEYTIESGRDNRIGLHTSAPQIQRVQRVIIKSKPVPDFEEIKLLGLPDFLSPPSSDGWFISLSDGKDSDSNPLPIFLFRTSCNDLGIIEASLEKDKSIEIRYKLLTYGDRSYNTGRTPSSQPAENSTKDHEKMVGRAHPTTVATQKVSSDEEIKVYQVNRLVNEFPEKEDFSTPESAYAAINRVMAEGKQSGWRRVSCKRLRDVFSAEDKNEPVDPAWAKTCLNAKILEVWIWKNHAKVIAELPHDDKQIREPIDLRSVELEGGQWLNTGESRFDTIEEARAKFDQAVEVYKHEEKEAAELVKYDSQIRQYSVNRRVASFDEGDFRTPESAYAAINRVSANGDPAGWEKVSVKELANKLAAERNRGKMNVPAEWAKVLLNAEILEVRIWNNEAVVMARLLQEFSTQPIRRPIDVRQLRLENGRWLNVGNDRVDSIEEGEVIFKRRIKAMTGKADKKSAWGEAVREIHYGRLEKMVDRAQPADATATIAVKVVDEEGKPIEGAIVTPDGMRVKPEMSGHIGWPAIIVGVRTNGDGVANVNYPRTTANDGEVGAISFTVKHPDYQSYRNTNYPVDGTALPIVLNKGATVKIRGYIGEKNNFVIPIYPLVSYDNNKTLELSAWKRQEDKSIVTHQMPIGLRYVQLMYFGEDHQPCFSERLFVNFEKGRTYEYSLELKRGLRLAGQLDSSVPRPVRNGKVMVLVRPADQKYDKEKSSPTGGTMKWDAWREVQPDGRFVFESLPPGKAELIAWCDGFVSTKSPELAKNPPVAPQLVALENDINDLNVPMEKTALCRVEVFDEQGQAISGAKVSMSPNVDLYHLEGTDVPFGHFRRILGSLADDESLFKRETPAQQVELARKSVEIYRRFSAVTDNHGLAQIDLLPSGRESLRVSHDGYTVISPPTTQPRGWFDRNNWGVVELKSGETTKVTVVMRKKSPTNVTKPTDDEKKTAGTAQPTTDESKARAEIEAVLKQFWQAVERKDLNGMLEVANGRVMGQLFEATYNDGTETIKATRQMGLDVTKFSRLVIDENLALTGENCPGKGFVFVHVLERRPKSGRWILLRADSTPLANYSSYLSQFRKWREETQKGFDMNGMPSGMTPSPQGITYRQLHFVRVVVGKDQTTFEGQLVPPDVHLVNYFANVKDRPNTVLEYAVDNDKLTLKEFQQIEKNIFDTAQGCGNDFAYLSNVGVHPLGSKGSPTKYIAVSPFAFDKVIPVHLSSYSGGMMPGQTGSERGGVFVKDIRFIKKQDHFAAEVSLFVSSWPKAEWEIQLRLLDKANKSFSEMWTHVTATGWNTPEPYIQELAGSFDPLPKDTDSRTATFEISIARKDTSDSVVRKPTPATSPADKVLDERKKTVGEARPTAIDEKPLTDNSENGKTFKAMFSNGVTAELAGIAYHPSKGTQWWRADGSELNISPCDWKDDGSEIQAGEKQKEYIFVIELANLSDRSLNRKWKISPSLSIHSSSSYCFKEGSLAQGFYGSKAVVASDVTKVNVSFGLAAGEWKPCVAGNGKVRRTDIVRLEDKVAEITLMEVYQVENQIRIEAKDDALNYANRIIAIDMEGKIHPASQMSWNSEQPLRLTKVRFDNLKLDQIKEFQFQTRPYEWVEFKNVSLEPGVKTDVEIVDGKGKKKTVGTAHPTRSEWQRYRINSVELGGTRGDVLSIVPEETLKRVEGEKGPYSHQISIHFFKNFPNDMRAWENSQITIPRNDGEFAIITKEQKDRLIKLTQNMKTNTVIQLPGIVANNHSVALIEVGEEDNAVVELPLFDKPGQKGMLAFRKGPTIGIKPDYNPETKQTTIEFEPRFWDVNAANGEVELYEGSLRNRISLPDRSTVLIRLPMKTYRMMSFREMSDSTNRFRWVEIEKQLKDGGQDYSVYVMVESVLKREDSAGMVDTAPPTTDVETKAESGIYLVRFSGKDSFKPRDGRELLNAFNENYPKGNIRTHHYSTKMVDGNLTGSIYVDGEEGIDAIKAMLKNSEKLSLVEITPVRVNELTTFLVMFKSAGSLKTGTAEELLEAFNAGPLPGIQTSYFRTEIQGSDLIGYIIADARDGKDSLAAKLRENKRITIMEIRPADLEMMQKIKQMKQVSLPMTVESKHIKSDALPPNAFENDPGRNLGLIWWRPEVVFNEKTVPDLQKKIEALTEEQIKSGNLDPLMEPYLSAFVFPLLATQGEKGSTVLGQFLKQYAHKKEKELDDRWLLIVASLGRDPNSISQAALEAEFDRFLKEYNFFKLLFSGKERQNHIFALYDALLACYAGQGILTADRLEGLTKGNKFNEVWFVWRMGLEWAWLKMPENKVLDIVAEVLDRSKDQDLIDVISFKGTQDLRLSAINQFITPPERTRWRVIPAMLSRSKEYRKPIRDFLLVMYVHTLIMQAEAGGGPYTLDEKVVKMLLTENLSNYPMFCYFCRILLSCHPTNGSEAWQAFLKKYAEKMDPKGEMYIEGGLMRIYDPKAAKSEGLYEPRPKHERNTPGVYINGSRWPMKN